MTVGPDTARAALFLDRDGVINVDRGYVHRIEDFAFIPGIFDIATTACSLGMAVVVVTNQSGIGRGYYGEADFAKLTDWMIGRFREEGATIDRVYHCPYHPTAGTGTWRREHPWRKPAPGMLLQAATDLNLSLADSVMLGDKHSDIEAARAGGIGLSILFDASSERGGDVRTVGALGEVPALLKNWIAARKGGAA